MAEYRMKMGADSLAMAEAHQRIEPLLGRPQRARAVERRFVRVLARLGISERVGHWLEKAAADTSSTPAARADVSFTKGFIAEVRDDVSLAEQEYRRAVAENPYHREARVRLIAVLLQQNKNQEAAAIREGAGQLDLPLGPGFESEVEELWSGRRVGG
jgi:thioredoxin-like negative regulator of GroEL